MEETFWDVVLVILSHLLFFLVGLREGKKEWERQSKEGYRKQWF